MLEFYICFIKKQITYKEGSLCFLKEGVSRKRFFKVLIFSGILKDDAENSQMTFF